MSILLSSYFSGIFLKKTALLECCQHGDFFKIQQRYGRSSSKALVFRYQGVDYFPYASEEDIIRCMNQRYAYIVIDFGCDYIQWKQEYLRCQKKILLGSTSDWEMEEFQNFLRWTQMERKEGWLYAGFLGSTQNRKKLEKEMEISIANVPYFEHPYRVDESVMRFFHKFFEG